MSFLFQQNEDFSASLSTGFKWRVFICTAIVFGEKNGDVSAS
jgi:hypothetical protein